MIIIVIIITRKVGNKIECCSHVGATYSYNNLFTYICEYTYTYLHVYYIYPHTLILMQPQICSVLGSLIAELNAAHMLELQGFVFESREGYRVALGKYYVYGKI
jgi:hypothetical protein